MWGALISAVGGVVTGSLGLAGTKSSNKTALELQANERRMPVMSLYDTRGSNTTLYVGIVAIVIVIVLIIIFTQKKAS